MKMKKGFKTTGYVRRKAVQPKITRVKRLPYNPRGGFTASLKPYNLPQTISGTIRDAAREAKNKKGTDAVLGVLGAAARGAGRAIRNADITLQMGTNPNDTSTTPTKLPIVGEMSTRRSSGYNGTWNSKVHVLKVTAGRQPGKYLRDSMQLIGEKRYRHSDTRYGTLTGDARKALTLSYGFNQKFVGFVGSPLFGWTPEQVMNDIGFTSYSTSIEKLQRAYASVSCLRSSMQLTNNNKILPMYVKTMLIRQIVNGVNFGAAVTKAYSADNTIQDAGAMPIAYQLGPAVQKTGGSILETFVDPTKGAIHSSPNALANYEIVSTHTTKLSAGDSLDFTYDHKYRSGINMEQLFSMASLGGGIDPGSSYTYRLALELWGPAVEAVALDGLVAPIDDERYRGSGPGHFSMEFQKYMIGVKPKGPNSTSAAVAGGWVPDTQFDIRLFTREYDGDTTVANRIKNYPYEALDVANGFRIPLITDTQVEKGGSKK
jgi:hypothetical protein